MSDVKYTPTPFRLDNHGLSIWCKSAKGGERKVADVRGWGYLTGKGSGALGLGHEEAVAEQKAVGAFIVRACNSYYALVSALEIVTSNIHPGDDKAGDAFVDLNGAQVEQIYTALALAKGAQTNGQ